MASVYRPCPQFGCTNLLKPGEQCPVHGMLRSRRYERTRESSPRRGYDARWNAFAAAYRRRHPLCRWCAERGEVVVTQQVDHIVPLELAAHRKFDEDNLQPLCLRDHVRKTAAEREAKLHGRDLITQPIMRRDVESVAIK